MNEPLRIVSVSGGKDPAALYCWAIDQFGKDGFVAVFADTGHEHPVTLNYVRNIPRFTNGPEIHWVRGDFADRLILRGKEPTGNPFFDMMLWKGRAPSSRAQFCTEHLKLRPIKAWLDEVRGDCEPVMFTGIRAGESPRRAAMPAREFLELYDCYTERPLLQWTEEQVFEFLRLHNMAPNPLYAAGFTRVGCFPCIHARKSEIAGLPEWAWKKLEEWEGALGRTWFSFGVVPLTQAQKSELQGLVATGNKEAVKQWKNENSPRISEVREWCKTSHGGSQFDLLADDAKDVPSCISTWGACE